MFRVKKGDGRFAWINPTYVQAVLPGEQLNQATVILYGVAVPVEGIADEIGKALTLMMAGRIPMADVSETPN
jgi:hypothetical protein